MSSQRKKQLEQDLKELEEKLANQEASQKAGEGFDERWGNNPEAYNDIDPVQIAEEIKNTENEIKQTRKEIANIKDDVE